MNILEHISPAVLHVARVVATSWLSFFVVVFGGYNLVNWLFASPKGGSK